jgi:DNA-binding transcriptional ArsR family regulator
MKQSMEAGVAWQLARLAGLLADETRAGMCLALLDGRAWTAGELARHTGVAPSTATEHLHRLIAGNLLVEHRQGRHRYVRLADPRIATLIEDLTANMRPVEPPGTLRAAKASAAMARGRTCYDHFAGRLGVAVADGMLAAGYLDESFALTAPGRSWLTGTLGVAPEDLTRGRRPLARQCVDWTERRPHLAGLAGVHIRDQAMARGWVERIGTTRAVRVTKPGEQALKSLLDITPEALH